VARFWKIYLYLYFALSSGWLALFLIVRPAVEYLLGIQMGRLVARISVAAFLGLVALAGIALALRILGLTPKTEERSPKQLIKPRDLVVMVIVMLVVVMSAAAIFAFIPDIANNQRLMSMLTSVIPGALLLICWLTLLTVMKRRESRLRKEKDGF